MAAKPENVIADIGKQLTHQSRPTKDFLVKSLRQAASVFSELDQLSSLKPYLRPLIQSLAKHGLLRHKDKDVKLLVAVCYCEIMRILAPEPSFDDKTFKGIFELFIGMFMELGDTTSPYFSRRVKILETVASLECCRRMLDLDCDDLILKMFKTFFSVVREEHQRSLIIGMLSIMSLILNEEETPQPLLEVVLHNLRNKGKGRAPASYHLAASLIQSCAEKIKPAICGFLTSCILDRDSVRSELKDCYHEIIFEIFRCTPHVLLAVIPNLAQELLTDQVDVRIKSVNLIGKLLTLPKDHDIHEYHYLFVELLKRFSDKSAEVRISVVRAVKSCYMADPSGIEAREILSSLECRLLDFDASVRTEAVAVVCDLARLNLKNFPETLIACATQRLRDKMTSVRKEALGKLMEVYREYCTQCYEGHMVLNKCYEKIPCKILMLCCDKNLKEFRPQNLELLLAESFPTSLPMEERTRHWIYLYSLFTPANVKGLNLVLCQKRRLQKEMRGYLSLRRKEKGIDPEEVTVRIKNAFTQMSAAFPNPVKAEESFYRLNQLKDSDIFDMLLQLLGEPALLNAKAMRDKFLNEIGDKHPHFEFLETLSLKCSHNIFSAEHVRYILDHVSSSRDREEDHLDQSAFNLLSDIIRSFPLLLRGSEHQFKMLILQEDSPMCAKLVQILAKIGPFISIELGEIYPLLERLCLEGTRSQSKAAISAIAALMGPSEQFLVVDLCQKLVKSLRVGRNLPTVLQSLGCISQHFFPMFKKHKNEVSSYIRGRILEEKMTDDDVHLVGKTASEVSFDCKLKIYGLKTLVMSALPKTELRGGEHISNLLDILSGALLTGELAEGATTCEIDMAHIKLAAAKSVLRLSRRWDLHISPQTFQSTIMMAKGSPAFVRKEFLDKTHKLLKVHAVSSKFACTFALAASDSVKDLQDASLKYLMEFIKEHSRVAPSCPPAAEGSLTDCPAYVVVFLLHVLAHDAGFPPISSHSEELFAQFCRPLVLILQLLVNSQFFDGDLDLVKETFLNLRSIFRAIKRAEDAIDPEITPKLHILADIGISILDVLKHDDINLSLAPGLVMLPSSLYRSGLIRTTKEGNNCPIGFVVNENFVRKLVRFCERDYSQLSRTSVKCGRKCVKDSLHDENIAVSSVPKHVDVLRNVTTQENIAQKKMAEICIVEACPKEKQQAEVICSSPGMLLLQDGSSVIEEVEADIAGNFESSGAKEHQVDSGSAALELFGTVSDVSTQEVDVSLSVSQQVGRKRKSSCGSAESLELSKIKLRHCCSSDGSNVSLVRQCGPGKQCLGDIVKETVNDSGKGAAVKQGKGAVIPKVLLDRTNSLQVNGLQKHFKPEKSSRVPQVYMAISASDVSDVSKDSSCFVKHLKPLCCGCLRGMN